MRKTILIILSFLFIAGMGFSKSIEEQIREFAKNKYPYNTEMQNYVFNQQLSAYKYMLSVKDVEVKQIALREYPNDFEMQQYTYNNQLAAKNYMKTVSNSIAKAKAQREYPNDYSMQKYTYDNLINK